MEFLKKHDFSSCISQSSKLICLEKQFSSNALRSFLKSYTGKNYERLFNFIASNSNAGEVVGYFKCSYNKSLNLDGFKYTRLIPNINIASHNNIYPVKLDYFSDGLDDERIVALFPETFMGNKAKDEDPVFYFIDRFVNRHLTITRKVINYFGLQDFFSELYLEGELDPYFVNWVLLHESSHRKGVMPIPQYLYEKSSPIGAAIEELRADLETMLTCLRNIHTPEYRKTFLLVLAERMLVYPLVREMNSFDALSSIILFSKVYRNLNYADLIQNIKELITEIEAIERSAIKVSSRVERKSYTDSAFNKLYLKYSSSYNDFKLMKETLES